MTTENIQSQKKSRKPRNKWTHIFLRVMEYLLRNYKVQITPEYELYKEPMRIEIVIIKLLEDVIIKNTAMKFFKKHNVIEFKGPTDILNIEAFDRVLSYFYAYLSQNSLSLQDVALTFVSVKKPEKLFEILKNNRKYKIVSAKANGIYYIKSITSPAIQLLVISELSAQDLIWIKAIRNDWTAQEGIEIVKRFESTGENKLLREVLYSLCTANEDILEEVEKMTESKKVIKFLDSWAVRSGRAQTWMREAEQKGMQKGMQEGRQEERQRIFAILQQQGYDVNSIKSKLPREFA